MPKPLALNCIVPASQTLLFPDPRPLVERLGPDFFRQLTDRPGVYLLRDANGLVLYVGKAKNLRKRLGSYRVANPDRLGRRHLRLLSQVARIELQECADESAALAEEAELLLALKPKFNRAGVWPGDPAFSHLAPDRTNAANGHHGYAHHRLTGIWPLWLRDRLFARRSGATALVCRKSCVGFHCHADRLDARTPLGNCQGRGCAKQRPQ